MKLSLPKISERDQALILIALGILAAVAVYLLVYQRFTEETRSLESTNATMQQQINLLQQLTDNRATYEADTSQFIDDTQEILDTFPVDLMEEDLILYANYLDEREDETYISSITTPRRQAVGIDAPAREDQLVSANDITGQIAANAYVNDGSVLDVSDANLLESTSGMVINTSYNGFKNLIIDLIGWEMEGQRRVNNVTMTYDNETGGVMTTMDVSFYALSGLDRIYEEPDPGEVESGLSNIFGNGLPNGMLLPPLSDNDPTYSYEPIVPLTDEETEDEEEGTDTVETPDTEEEDAEVTGTLQTP